MLYSRSLATARRGDALDEVRVGALARTQSLITLLDRRWAAFDEREAARRSGSGDYDELLDAEERLSDELDDRLERCAGTAAKDTALALMLTVGDGTTVWEHTSALRRLDAQARAQQWSPAEAEILLEQVLEIENSYEYKGWFVVALGFALAIVQGLDAGARPSLTPRLDDVHRRLRETSEISARDQRELSRSLLGLLAEADSGAIPDGVVPDAAWASPLRALIGDEPSEGTAALVRHLTALPRQNPSRAWRQRCLELADAVSAREALFEGLRGLAEGKAPSRTLVGQSDTGLAQGIIWAASLIGGAEAVPLLGALVLRTGTPGTDVLEERAIAGTAMAAIADIDDPAALRTLWELQGKVKRNALRERLGAAIESAAARQRLTPCELVERNVPDLGLGPDGTLRRPAGADALELRIEDAKTARIVFVTATGAARRSVPAATQRAHAAHLAELKALTKQVRTALSAERQRIEALLAAEHTWPYGEWCRLYRDHPITGAVARTLIWEFEDPAGHWTAAMGDAPADAVRVRLWHPIRASADEIGAWRASIDAAEIRQPFKQAFREIYLLTPAEEEARDHSDRFAGHILHARQSYALFKARGWKGGFREPARGTFADGAWRASFTQQDTGDHLYNATGRVVFERRDGRRWQGAELAEVPPLVFSEAMRDVDLFVGVTSIAADPDWGEDGHTAYWRTASFGELTASAESRRDVLERLLPRTKIADRCVLDGRFLRVRGDLRTYKIHLGSANVLMEPDDAYLCVIAGRPTSGKIYLPFEDERLSVILSKAFLLADDAAITDESILLQIKRGA